MVLTFSSVVFDKFWTAFPWSLKTDAILEGLCTTNFVYISFQCYHNSKRHLLHKLYNNSVVILEEFCPTKADDLEFFKSLTDNKILVS